VTSSDATLGVLVERPPFCNRLLFGGARIGPIRRFGCDSSDAR
jgi:hypothetical protein